MLVKSFVKRDRELIPVEVEVTLLPGLPQMHFLGLADQNIKESRLRIRSAFKHCGFQWPKVQQILVNLRPNQEKKTSAGLDFAIALAVLCETRQLKDFPLEDAFVYGELTLTGEVFEPDDASLLAAGEFKGRLLTGAAKRSFRLPMDRLCFRNLKSLSSPKLVKKQMPLKKPIRPEEFIRQNFSKQQAELLKVVALGGHSTLLAGPAGSGKSFLCQSLLGFLTPPTPAEVLQIQKFDEALSWRPLVKPHHSTPMTSLLGGGSQMFHGEVQKAHLGVLMLEELLEFSSKFLEALREPLEERVITIARLGRSIRTSWRAQVVATTNLCPCGMFVPGQKVSCRFSLKKCQSYSERLSGPLVDRFEVLAFSVGWTKSLGVRGEDILADIQAARSWALAQNFQSLTMERQIQLRWSKVMLLLLPPQFPSLRRKHALLSLGLTFANLDRSLEVRREHLQKALELSYMNHLRLQTYGVNC